MSTEDIYSQTIKHFLAPIWEFLEDADVSEVMVNGPRTIYVEKRGMIENTDCAFPDDAALMAAVQNVAEYVGRPLDRRNHSLDGRLPDGSRVHAIIPPSSRQGVCLTIRRFQQSLVH